MYRRNFPAVTRSRHAKLNIATLWIVVLILVWISPANPALLLNAFYKNVCSACMHVITIVILIFYQLWVSLNSPQYLFFTLTASSYITLAYLHKNVMGPWHCIVAPEYPIIRVFQTGYNTCIIGLAGSLPLQFVFISSVTESVTGSVIFDLSEIIVLVVGGAISTSTWTSGRTIHRPTHRLLRSPSNQPLGVPGAACWETQSKFRMVARRTRLGWYCCVRKYFLQTTWVR